MSVPHECIRWCFSEGVTGLGNCDKVLGSNSTCGNCILYNDLDAAGTDDKKRKKAIAKAEQSVKKRQQEIGGSGGRREKVKNWLQSFSVTSSSKAGSQAGANGEET